MKKNVISFLLGCMIMFCITCYAENLLQTIKVEYPINFNGTKIKNVDPILNCNGKTYLSLKDISNVFKASVQWDNKNKCVDILKLNTLNNQDKSIFIDSAIEGKFNGFSYNNTYKLLNGQVWQQTSPETSICTLQNPEVYIFFDESQFTYKMLITNLTNLPVVSVKQLK